jgi:hypothetical protein
MTAAEKQATLKKYKKTKAYTDKQHVTMLKLLASADVMALPKKSQVGLFLGDHHAMIRTMVAVKSSCLAIYHSFQLKEIHQICISKKGNLWQIKHKTIRSDQVNLVFAGFNF